MLNISNMTHTALLGQLINTCHIYIKLVKRFCKCVDLMLTSRNAIVRHFVRRAIYSAQSPIGRHIAVIRHRYAIHVIDINVKHVGEIGYGCHTFYITDVFRNIVILTDTRLLLCLNMISCAHINMQFFIFTS